VLFRSPIGSSSFSPEPSYPELPNLQASRSPSLSPVSSLTPIPAPEPIPTSPRPASSNSYSNDTSAQSFAPIPDEWSSIADLLQASPEPQPISEQELPEITSTDGYNDLNLYPDPSPSNLIQREPTSPEASTDATTASETSSEGTDDESKNAGEASAEKLERLAQAIYQLVRQRLAIERERSGSGYSGRLL